MEQIARCEKQSTECNDNLIDVNLFGAIGQEMIEKKLEQQEQAIQTLDEYLKKTKERQLALMRQKEKSDHVELERQRERMRSQLQMDKQRGVEFMRTSRGQLNSALNFSNDAIRKKTSAVQLAKQMQEASARGHAQPSLNNKNTTAEVSMMEEVEKRKGLVLNTR